MKVSNGKLSVSKKPAFTVGSNAPFLWGMGVIAGSYILLIILLVVADLCRADVNYMMNMVFGDSPRSEEIRYAIMLSLLSCTVSAVLSVIVAVPIGYIMSRFQFRGKTVLDTVLDIPIVLPPLVVGVSLLILFNYWPFEFISRWVVLEVPAVIIAQFMVACAFAVRTMRVTFDQIPQRYEAVAMTLGCNRSSAFWRVIMPQAKRGMLAALTLAWARSLGEFGPILVFAGSTRMRTEVLPTSVYLEMQAGNLDGMLSVSLLMIVTAVIVLIVARLLGVSREHII